MATKSFTTSESSTRTRTLTYELPGLIGTPIATVNTGNVTIDKIEGNKVTVTFRSGSYTDRVQTGGSYTASSSKTVTDYMTNSKGSCARSGMTAGEAWDNSVGGFPSTMSYNSGGFSGTLSTSGAKTSSVRTWTDSLGRSCTETTYEQAYRGTVTKPASDTRTYTNYYRYTVTFTYTDNVAPTVPSSLVATGNFRPGSVITLTSDVSTDVDNDIVYYQYQYTTDGGSSWSTISTVTDTTPTFTIPTNITSNFIQFRVRAYDNKEYSSFRTSSEYAVIYNTAPSAPTSVYIEGNPSHVTRGMEYSLIASGATDVDNDTLTYHFSYSLDGWNTWTNFNATPTNGILSGIKFEQLLANLESTTLQVRARAFDGTVYSGHKLSPTYQTNSKSEINITSPDDLVEYNEGDKVLIQGSSNDSDPNQVVMVYYEVGNSGERVITSSISGATFPFEKSLTFKGNALYDGDLKVADKLVPNGVLGEVEFKFYAKDTIGAVSEKITKILTMRPNQNPILEIETNVATLDEGGSFKTTITAKDVDEDGLKVALKLRGHEIEYEIDLGTSNGEESNLGEVELNAFGSTLYLGTDRTKPFNVTKLSTGTYYLDIVAKDEHGAQSDVKTVTISLTANRKPLVVINEVPKLVSVTNGESIFYGSVTDLDLVDKPNLTFRVRINGKDLEDIYLDPETGEFDFRLNYGDERVGIGFKTLVFIASDGKETTTVTREFEIVDEKILFEFKNPIETDEIARKVSILLGYHMTHDATLKVEMCNNAFDETPTWEDITHSVINNTAYSFQNNTNTADRGGINIRVELVKNNAPTVYVDRIGILFE